MDADRDERHQADHEHGQRQRHRDMAGEGEEQREDAEQVAEQDEEEQREDEREEAAAFRPIVSVHMFITVSYAISAADCSRPGTIARGRMPTQSRPSVSRLATTIIRLACVKFTEAPIGPSAGSSLNWLSASIDPPAATIVPRPGPWLVSVLARTCARR